MERNVAIGCPRCGQLVNKDSSKCPNCGLPVPGRVKVLGFSKTLDVENFIRVLIWTNVAIYVVSIVLSRLGGSSGGFLGFLSPSSRVLELMGWASPLSTFSGSYWQLVTACFLHGGVIHIAMNMLWINDLSRIASNFFSTATLIVVYAFSGVTGNVVALFLGGVPVVGASGAVFGMMGAIVIFGYLSRSVFARMYMAQIGKWAVILILLGFVIPGISNSAHIGGMAGGALMGYLLANFQHRSPLLIGMISLVSVGLVGLCLGIMAIRIFWLVLAVLF